MNRDWAFSLGLRQDFVGAKGPHPKLDKVERIPRLQPGTVIQAADRRYVIGRNWEWRHLDGQGAE